MITKSNGYQTRLDGADSTLVQSGSFGGSIDQITVDRLVNNHFNVVVRQSGRCVFVDNQGRQVQLYLCVNPLATTKDKTVYDAWREQERQRRAIEANHEEQLREELDTMIDLIGLASVLAKLKRGSRMNRPQFADPPKNATNFYHPEMVKYLQATGVSLVPNEDWFNTHALVDVDDVVQLKGRQEWLRHVASLHSIPIVNSRAHNNSLPLKV